MATSTDGGRTFAAPQAITGKFNEQDSSVFPASYRYASVPSLAVGPDGSLDVVYADQTGKGPKAQAKIEFIRAPKGNAKFSPPASLNDVSAGFRTMPAVAVDQSTGQIWVSWFDTRNSSDVNHYDIYATESSDGKKFTPDVRVTSQLQDGITGGGGFIGDYGGIAAAAGTAHPVWTSGEHHSSLAHLQTAALSLVPHGPDLAAGASLMTQSTAQAGDAAVLIPLDDQTSSDSFGTALSAPDQRRQRSL
jgi:hypothetical protein